MMRTSVARNGKTRGTTMRYLASNPTNAPNGHADSAIEAQRLNQKE